MHELYKNDCTRIRIFYIQRVQIALLYILRFIRLNLVYFVFRDLNSFFFFLVNYTEVP